MTHRTITIPPVTAALLAHGVTPYSTHGFRGSVQPGDRGIIVAGAGPVKDVPEGWFYDDERTPHVVTETDFAATWRDVPVVTRAARAVGTVAEVVPINPGRMVGAWVESSMAYLWRYETFGQTEHPVSRIDLSHLLPFADWSPTTASGKQRWAVRWEDMRVIEPAVKLLFRIAPPRESPVVPVPLHRGWRVADPGLVAAVGEASDG